MASHSIGYTKAKEPKERDDYHHIIRAKQLIKAADHELGNIIADREKNRNND